MNSSMIAAAGLRVITFCIVLPAFPVSAFAQDLPVYAPPRVEYAPPPAPPPAKRELPSEGRPRESLGPTLYSIGVPTDQEQLYLEYINRSRANPIAEAQRFATTTDADVLAAYANFYVNLGMMQAQFATNPAVAPVAMSARLMTAARLHSGDMLTNAFQSHTGSTGSSLVNRVLAQGYSWTALAENVYSFAKSVFHGHGGFDVDWGGTAATGGMQVPPGHRNNIHSASYREVGIGVVYGTNTGASGTVGPQLVTQDFGTESPSTAFITGVAYYDVNTNGFYDPGEGIGGLRVDSAGSSYYAQTPTSGGYALPVTSNGTYVVTFDAPGLSRAVTTNITSLRNIKVDFTPPYTPPVISGPNPAYLNQANLYSFSALAGATAYDWERTELAPYTTVEGAESGLGNVTVISSPGYSVRVSGTAASGNYSFHLTHLVPEDQFLTLNALLRPSATSQLSFAKKLSYAASDEFVRAQISTDGGVTWQDLWNQSGSNGPGESSFSTINVSLAAYAGSAIRVRFVYEFHSGSYYNCTAANCGLHLDNIAISNAELVSTPVSAAVASGTSFSFQPTNTSTWLLRARARINDRVFPWGPGVAVAVTTPPPVLQLAGKPVLQAGQVQLEFNVANYRAGMTFELWKTTDLALPMTRDTSASLTTVTPNSVFRFTTSNGSASRSFYRVKALY